MWETSLTCCVKTDIITLFHREAISNLTRVYFDQLTQGCKNKSCKNPHCATGSGKPLPHTEAGIAAVRLAMGLKTDKLCQSMDVNKICKSPTPIIDTNSHNSPSSSGITGHSSRHPPGQGHSPEPMDTVDMSSTNTNPNESNVPRTLSEPFTDASSSSEQIGNAASSTLILVASREDELQPSSSAEDVPRTISEESNSYDAPGISATTSSDMDLTTASDSISLSSIDVDSHNSPPKIKFSGSALFKSLAPNGKNSSFHKYIVWLSLNCPVSCTVHCIVAYV